MPANANAAASQADLHTPGPWKQKVDGFGISVFADSRPHIAVAIVGKGGRVKEERDANAHLVAAAPDLLAALKMARECIAYCRRAHKDAQTGEGVPVEIFLDAAINKAEGR